MVKFLEGRGVITRVMGVINTQAPSNIDDGNLAKAFFEVLYNLKLKLTFVNNQVILIINYLVELFKEHRVDGHILNGRAQVAV